MPPALDHPSLNLIVLEQTFITYRFPPAAELPRAAQRRPIYDSWARQRCAARVVDPNPRGDVSRLRSH